MTPDNTSIPFNSCLLISSGALFRSGKLKTRQRIEQTDIEVMNMRIRNCLLSALAVFALCTIPSIALAEQPANEDSLQEPITQQIDAASSLEEAPDLLLAETPHPPVQR